MDKPATIEVTEAAAPAKVELPTMAEVLKSGDLSPLEAQMAEKHGLVTKEKPKGDDKGADDKGDDKGDDTKGDDVTGDEGEVKDKAEEAGLKIEDLDKEVDPKKVNDQLEKAGFNKNEKGLYWSARKDRSKRQSAEADRDRAKIDAKVAREKAAKLEAELVEARKPKTKKEGDDDFNLDDVEDKNKPLTQADLDRIEKEKADKLEKENEAGRAHQKSVLAALDAQEAEFTVEHQDFPVIYDLTVDIMGRCNDEAKLKELFPDPVQRRGVKSMVGELIQAMTSADKAEDGTQPAAKLAYEIGQLHPKKKPGASGKTGEDENGDETGDESADELKRRLAAQERRSSAPLSGGGSRRVVELSKLTAEQVNALPEDEYRKLRREHPEVIERILSS